MHAMERKSSGDALLEAIALKDRKVVDIGSGDGRMVRFMTEHGARATGVECGTIQLERAHAAQPAGGERYLEGVGQALPLPDASADIVTFFNSLHHVPVAEMDKALAEAARVLKDGGELYIGEPLPEGPQFDLLRPVDDETEVRAAAYAAIERASEHGFDAIAETRFLEPRRIETFEALRDVVIAINPDRAALVASLEDKLRAHFEKLATRLPDGAWELTQPMRVNRLRRRPR